MKNEPTFSVTDFVAIFNQTLEYAYPSVTIVGELANLRISKGRWVYFDLKDENSSIKFFGSVYCLPGPLEDGIMVQVVGSPRLHNQYGFSLTARSVQPIGEGSIKKASKLLEDKLTKEGLFDESRKRLLPYPPKVIGLIASGESAAYHDFVKVLGERWSGIDIIHADIQVQGVGAPEQTVRAIEYFNSSHDAVDVLVITRGGGSPEDLVAFSSEHVVRAVAGSRIPTMVAIGHEIDISLAELAADKRASTPSNAAELLTPDRTAQLELIKTRREQLLNFATQACQDHLRGIARAVEMMELVINKKLSLTTESFEIRHKLLMALNPSLVLDRGYALVRNTRGEPITSLSEVVAGESLSISLRDGSFLANVEKIGE